MNHVEDTIRLVLGGYAFDPNSIDRFIGFIPDSVAKNIVLNGTVLDEFKKYISGMSGGFEDDENEDVAIQSLDEMIMKDDFMLEEDLRQILEWNAEGVIHECDAVNAILEGNRRAVKRFITKFLEERSGNKKAG